MGLYTQQDPIGIAGGLNLYGYANGDPINFSDPFGLCPEEGDDEGADADCPSAWEIAKALLSPAGAYLAYKLISEAVSVSASYGNLSVSGDPRSGEGSVSGLSSPQYGFSLDVNYLPRGEEGYLGSVFIGSSRHVSGQVHMYENPDGGPAEVGGISFSFGPGVGLPVGFAVPIGNVPETTEWWRR